MNRICDWSMQLGFVVYVYRQFQIFRSCLAWGLTAQTQQSSLKWQPPSSPLRTHTLCSVQENSINFIWAKNWKCSIRNWWTKNVYPNIIRHVLWFIPSTRRSSSSIAAAHHLHFDIEFRVFPVVVFTYFAPALRALVSNLSHLICILLL